jgi:hypothetical protein
LGKARALGLVKVKINEKIRIKTQKLRGTLIFSAMRLLTPNFLKEIIDWQTFVDRTPRPFTKFLSGRYETNCLIGVEIGFGYGRNAQSILKELNMRRLFCVDPLEPYANKFGDSIGYFADNLDKGLYPVISKDPRVCFIRLTSDEAFASGALPRGELDFVYVDGLHTPGQAYRDIMNALDFVKVGGVVGGHDFTQDHEDSVVPAVFKVSAETGLVPAVEMPDFWFIKNEDFSE